MKPICESEAAYIHWRSEVPTDKFSKWSKKQMTRAKRRFKKRIIRGFLNERFAGL